MLAAAVVASKAALASPPPNDDWASRTMITALPFIDVSPDIGEARRRQRFETVLHAVGLCHDRANSVWHGYDAGADDEYVSVPADGCDTPTRRRGLDGISAA